MTTYYVPVTFYIEARDEMDAAGKVMEYLDDAAASVLDRKDICGVDVEDHRVGECVDAGEGNA